MGQFQNTDMQTEYNYFATFAVPFCFVSGVGSGAFCVFLATEFYAWLKQGPKRPRKKGGVQ